MRAAGALPAYKGAGGGDFTFPFRFVADWYDYQNDFVRRLDPADFEREPAYCDTAALAEVLLYRKKVPQRKKARLCLYGDRITVDEDLVFPFAETDAVTVLGRNKLNLYHGGRVWQLTGDRRFNALKYVNFYHHYKNFSEGNLNGEFLGL